MTCWNWTNSGHSWPGARTSAGFGWLNAVVPARLLPTPLAAEAKLPAAFCGSVSRLSTRAACCSQISGLRMPTFCPRPSIRPEAQHQARGPASGPRPSIRPEAQHQATGKGDGQTCHIERFNNILRQRMGRLVRRTLSFSKTDEWHGWCLHLFLYEYNKNKLN